MHFIVAALLSASFAALPTPADFGAVGDGQSDDTAAIQRAIDAGQGGVQFSAGTYRITRSLRIELDRVGFSSLTGDGTAIIRMEGAGPAIQLIGTHGGTADPDSVEPRVWQRQRMPVIRGIAIEGGHEQADGIKATGTMQLTITETHVRRCRHAIHLTDRNRNFTLSNCHLYENRGCGVFYDRVNLHQSNIVGCHISYNAGGGIVVRGGEVRNIQIGTCDLESNMASGQPATANVLIDCTDGSTDEVAITGCTLQHNSKSVGSANIRFLGAGITRRQDPTPTQEGHVTITGNVMSDVMVNVHLQNVRGATITGNTFWEGFEHDLLIEASQAIVIGPNDLDRNPRYVVNGNWSRDRGGIVLRDCADCKLSGLLVKSVWQQPAAVMLEGCRRCTVRDLSVLDCDGIGILLRKCTACQVSDCLVQDDRPAEERRSAAPIVEEP
ncbi:MAG: right-handed parallel beta-helix repeat-containing protein [Planctomycetales bacterium]|nr:right-handed parallel beta-helix repeat-containing protein [Planctomycetales bacterium]